MEDIMVTYEEMIEHGNKREVNGKFNGILETMHYISFNLDALRDIADSAGGIHRDRILFQVSGIEKKLEEMLDRYRR